MVNGQQTDKEAKLPVKKKLMLQLLYLLITLLRYDLPRCWQREKHTLKSQFRKKKKPNYLSTHRNRKKTKYGYTQINVL